MQVPLRMPCSAGSGCPPGPAQRRRSGCRRRRRLEGDRLVVLLGGRRDFHAVLGQHRLVGGDDTTCPRASAVSIAALAGSPGPSSSTNASMPAPRRKRGRCVVRRMRRQIDAAIRAPGRAGGDRHDLDRAAAPRSERVALALDQPYDRCADGARARQDQLPADEAVRPSSSRLPCVRNAEPLGRTQRRVASGTTLCNFSSPVSNRRMLRAAWRIRCSLLDQRDAHDSPRRARRRRRRARPRPRSLSARP